MRLFILFLFCFFMAMNPVFAVEVAPRISDREIIESLMRLESGTKTNRQALEAANEANRQALEAAIEANRQALEAAIEANRQALEAANEANRQALEAAIEANRQAIEANRQAIEISRAEMLGFMKWGFGLLLTGMFILFGFILWDRRSTLKPIKDEIDELEKKKVNRLIATLKKSSENDVNIADAMRIAGLL